MNDAPHALIAGAGIGGLTTALCLARAGFRVRLLERAALLEEAGAGLQISSNASAVLRDLGVLPRLSAAALAPEAIHIKRWRDGATLQRLLLQDAEQRWGAPYLLIHRADLQKALLEAVAEKDTINVSMRAELAGFAANETGIEATARHGAVRIRYSADCLIGADGLRSFVRQRLADIRNTGHAGAKPAEVPRYAKHVAWRALVDAEQVPAELRRKESTLWLGPKAHLVHYPLRAGSVINVVAVVEAPVSIDWTGDIWSQSGPQREIIARFSDWHEDARTLIAAARTWRKWPLVDLDPLPAWTMGRVALLGDAAHPMLPFLAQGAAQAIEDAAMLGALLKPHCDIAAALAAYAEARHKRASKVQAQSRRQAQIYHLAGPAALVRDLALRSMGARQWLAGYDWLYRA
ncbi:MAG: FAD-dependent monooxygenase [Methylovirgula sp.]